MIQKKIQAKIKYKPKKIQARVKGTKLVFLLVNVVNAEEGTSEGGSFAEGYKDGFVDLALGVDEDATKEKN